MERATDEPFGRPKSKPVDLIGVPRTRGQFTAARLGIKWLRNREIMH